MGVFYTKNADGKYIPIEFKKICSDDWHNRLIVVKIGDGGDKVPESEIEEVWAGLNDADALGSLDNTSFLITLYNLDFQILESVKDIGDQYITVRITGDDDLSKLGALTKKAKEELRGKAKKVVILPAPLSVNEFREVMEIKQRCDTRRNRRGR
jgi:hypothetical protein